MGSKSIGQAWVDDLFARSGTLRPTEQKIISNLLFDHTTRRNIMWCTPDYASLGYASEAEIKPEAVTAGNAAVVQARYLKTSDEQRSRSRDKAEVFTPAWICNAQNNLIDGAWFGREGVFNTETFDPATGLHSWTVNPHPITFPEGTTWRDYVLETRLEITCGEAPYLASLYDAATGDAIAVPERVGLLDRKLRVVSENTDTSEQWLNAAHTALQRVLGYEWQGDSLLLARRNLLATFIDFYHAKFTKVPQLQSVSYSAYIISWNLWQMDGLKGVVPGTCCEMPSPQMSIFDDDPQETFDCEGCRTGNLLKHNGTYCLVRDWGAKKPNDKIRFIDLINHKRLC